MDNLTIFKNISLFIFIVIVLTLFLKDSIRSSGTFIVVTKAFDIP